MVMQGSDGFVDGVDIYGADLAVELLLEIRREHPEAGLVIGRPTAGDAAFQAYCRRLDERIAQAGATGAVWILDGERELWPAIKAADLFLRPTLSDGDSIGVREALHFGIPVVASDAAPRPDSVHLFPSRSLEGLVQAVRKVLSQSEVGACS